MSKIFSNLSRTDKKIESWSFHLAALGDHSPFVSIIHFEPKSVIVAGWYQMDGIEGLERITEHDDDGSAFYRIQNDFLAETKVYDEQEVLDIGELEYIDMKMLQNSR